MEIKFPESSYIKPPHKVEDGIGIAKKSFFEMAKSRVRYMHSKEFKEWVTQMIGESKSDQKVAAGLTAFWIQIKGNQNGTEERFIENLEIGIDLDAFHLDGDSYQDLIPFIIEHELQETWLNTKRGLLGSGDDLETLHTRHLLAERKEFLLAEQSGLGEKLFQWRMKIHPDNEAEYRTTWESAKKKMRAH